MIIFSIICGFCVVLVINYCFSFWFSPIIVKILKTYTFIFVRHHGQGDAGKQEDCQQTGRMHKTERP